MISNVLIFENLKPDQEKFRTRLEQAGCKVLILNNPHPKNEIARIGKFSPDLIIVDCNFQYNVDGIGAILEINKICPHVPIVVCTILLHEEDKRKWVYEKYSQLPNVRRIIGKIPFPTAEQLISL